jgi:hypothetical protein
MTNGESDTAGDAGMRTRRGLAFLALLCAAVSAIAAVVLTVAGFPRGLSVLVCVGLAAYAGWFGLRRRGAPRALALACALILIAGAVVLVVLEGKPLLNLAVIAVFGVGVLCARSAFSVHVRRTPEAAPLRPVLFFNPLSGGGKAERFHLVDEAKRRGIEPVELTRGVDLETLVREAVSNGADGLAMAGGDGSQAVVAKVAAELGLPYACIPAGTRNHFALDLGVDRDDVVGALDAFVNGGERRVDLAEVNGRVFVNNVSLGLYAEAVQKSGYRSAKIRTLLDTVPDSLGPAVDGPGLEWTESDGSQGSGAVMLVSNNRYRLGRLLGSGTRPRLDGGILGIAVFAPTQGRGLSQWAEPTFEVRADQPVPAGIDGEATTLDPPLQFRVLPGVLRVRIAPQHPGASPSAVQPDSVWQTFGVLAEMALGHDPTPAAEQIPPVGTAPGLDAAGGVDPGGGVEA